MSGAASGKPYDETGEGARLRIRLTPRGGRNGLDRLVQLPDGRWAAQARVAAPPVDGAANNALIAWLAEALGLPRSRLRLAAGHTARIKTVELTGRPAELAGRLDAWLAGASRKA